MNLIIWKDRDLNLFGHVFFLLDQLPKKRPQTKNRSCCFFSYPLSQKDAKNHKGNVVEDSNHEMFQLLVSGRVKDS